MLSNFLPQPDEPAPNDLIRLLGADDRPDGRYSRVQRVLSADFDGKLFEVIDRQGRHMIIAPANEGDESWVQTPMEV